MSKVILNPKWFITVYNSMYEQLSQMTEFPDNYAWAVDVGKGFVNDNVSFMMKFTKLHGKYLTTEKEMAALGYAVKEVYRIGILESRENNASHSKNEKYRQNISLK